MENRGGICLNRDSGDLGIGRIGEPGSTSNPRIGARGRPFEPFDRLRTDLGEAQGGVQAQLFQVFIACGRIDIGNAATDMRARMPAGAAQTDGWMRVEPTVDVEHVGSTVVYMLNMRLATNARFSLRSWRPTRLTSAGG